MTLVVDLPADELIEYERMVEAIARARLFKGGLTGLDCITGKAVALTSPSQLVPGQSELFVPEGSESATTNPTLHRASPGRAGIDPALFLPNQRSGLFVVDEASNARDLNADAWGDQEPMRLCYPLTGADRVTLARLLPDLPPLRAPLGFVVREAFLAAYRAHSDRANWEPVLLPAYDASDQLNRLETLITEYKQVLREDFGEHRFTAFDRDHRRVNLLVAGTFIPRQMAIDYLKQWHDMVVGSSVAAEETPMLPSTNAAIVNEPQTVLQPIVPNRGRLLRMADLVEWTGLSQATLYSFMDAKSKYFDPTFPAKVPLGLRATAYWSEDVDAWLQRRAKSLREPRV